jgi:hypothetical protein
VEVYQRAAIFGGNMNLPKYAVISLCAGFLAGCSFVTAKAPPNQGMTNLQELKQLLRAAEKRAGHAPARLSDLDLFRTCLP